MPHTQSGPTGLVCSQTSDTRLEIDPTAARLRRMKSGVITAARLIQDRLQNSRGRRWRAAMLTLTYRDQEQFTPKQVTGLLKCLRQWAGRRGFVLPYVWVLERGTLRGRLHYHVLVWLPPGLSLPKPDKQGWWRWGMTRIEWARRAVGYLAKYASKGGTGFPKGSRIHGCGGLEDDERAERSWWLCPRWVRDTWASFGHRPAPAPGGGWFSRLTGEHRPSPWRVVFSEGRIFIEAKHEQIT
jgi:hypothetical protein